MFWRSRRDPALEAFADYLATRLRQDAQPELALVAEELSEAQLRMAAELMSVHRFSPSQATLRALSG